MSLYYFLNFPDDWNHLTLEGKKKKSTSDGSSSEGSVSVCQVNLGYKVSDSQSVVQRCISIA